jgi:hypothetical protein
MVIMTADYDWSTVGIADVTGFPIEIGNMLGYWSERAFC